MSDIGAELGRESLISKADPNDFLALLKPRVMSLVVFTALVGLLFAPGTLHPVLGAISIFAIALGAGASGALNMWYDADIDAKMRRTASRPVPAGRVTANEARGFGLFLSVLSVAILGLAANWIAAALLAFTIFFYVVIYTMGLKRFTAQNIVIGGAAGALPPVVGWAAVNGEVGLAPLILFAIIFLWTPPHFWALALVRNEDYDRAGVPMLPVIAGPAATKKQILLYTFLLVPVTLLPVALGFAGPLYGATALIGNGLMLKWAIDIRRANAPERERKACFSMFGGSILYLFALFAALLLEWLIARLLPFLPVFGWRF